MTDEENEALKLYCLLKDPQIELHCRAVELRQEIKEQLDRAELGPSPEMEQRHKDERLEVQQYLDFDQGDHHRAILALQIGPDEALARGMDYPDPLDPEYEKLMYSLAQRQYAEAQAFKTKLDDALKSEPLDNSAITQFRDEYQRLYDGFSTEKTRYGRDYDQAKHLAEDWHAREKNVQDINPKITR